MRLAIINSTTDVSSSTGSLGNALFQYARSKGDTPFFLYGRGKRSSESGYFKVDLYIDILFHKAMTLLTGYQGYFSNLATCRLIRYLKKENITHAILLNLHGYYLNEAKLLRFLKQNDIATLYITPDEYAGLGKCCYSFDCEKYQSGCYACPQITIYPKSLFFDRSRQIFDRKKNCYDGFKRLSFAGPESNLDKFRYSALIKDFKMYRLDWGADTSRFYNDPDEIMYEKYSIPRNKIIILTVAKYSAKRKGVADYLFPVARALENTDYHFINVGYDGNLGADDIPGNLTTIPYISDGEELRKLYSISDAYFLPSTADTQPISCLIAMACGIPVCCFYTYGLKYLAPRDAGVVRYIDEISISAVIECIRGIKELDEGTKRKCRDFACDNYSLDSFCKRSYEALLDTSNA